MLIQTEVKHSEKQQKIRVCSVLLVEMEPVCFAPPPIKLLLCAQIFASLALPEVTATTGLGSASCCRHRERTHGTCFHQLRAHRLNCPNLSPLVCKQNSGPHLKESLGRKLQFLFIPTQSHLERGACRIHPRAIFMSLKSLASCGSHVTHVVSSSAV